jgi:hypothetical protein
MKSRLRDGVALVAALVTLWAVDGASTADADSVPVIGESETVTEEARDGGIGDSVTAAVAVGWSGKPGAVWYRPAPAGSDLLGRLMASTRSKKGTWSRPVRITRRIPDPGDMVMSMGRVGQVSVVWSKRVSKGRWVVLEAHRENGAWSRPTRLGRGKHPRVAHGGDGVTHVLWVHKNAVIASRPRGGSWTLRRFNEPGEPMVYDLAVNRAGEAIAMWNGSVSSCVSTATRTRDSERWTRSAEPHEACFVDFEPALGVFRNGTALAAWIDGEQVRWARRSATGHWSPARTFGRPNGIIEQSGGIRMAVAGNDQALVVWSAEIGGYFAAGYRDGRFGTPSKLNQKGLLFRARGGVVSADGSALVAGDTLGGRIGYRWQRGPRRNWRLFREVTSAGDVYSVAGRGRRTAILLNDEGLRVRVIDLARKR